MVMLVLPVNDGGSPAGYVGVSTAGRTRVWSASVERKSSSPGRYLQVAHRMSVI
jgi:hypothetical protein